MNLRPYQLEAIEELSVGFKKHQRQIFVLPTGGGKTVVFSEIALRATQKGKTVLILTDRKELFKQASAALGRLNIPVCEINPNNKYIHAEAKLFVGMVETVARRIEQLKTLKLDLIIIDEAHKGNFFKILDAFPNVKAIGATATPINKNLHKYYTTMVNIIDIPELVEQGYLCECKPFQMQDDFSDVKSDKNEFNEESLFKHFNKSKLYEGVVDQYISKCNGMKTIVFNVNIEHSETMTKAFVAAGIQSYSITSNTSDFDRQLILQRFSRGEFKVLNNCGILTTGYDEPSIECVIVNRATLSLALWLQMQGRGSRTFNSKRYFMVLDFGMNHDRHGLWSEKRQWELKPPKKKKNGIGAAPIKVCVICEAMIPAVSKKCSFCGHEYEIGNVVLRNGQLIEVKPKIPTQLVERHIGDLSIEELIELQKTKMHTPQMVWRVVRSKGHEAIEQYAKLQGYGYGWIVRQKNETGTNFNNYKIKQIEL